MDTSGHITTKSLYVAFTARCAAIKLDRMVAYGVYEASSYIVICFFYQEVTWGHVTIKKPFYIHFHTTYSR